MIITLSPGRHWPIDNKSGCKFNDKNHNIYIKCAKYVNRISLIITLVEGSK